MGVAVEDAWIEAVIDEVGGRDGVAAYLSDHGVTQQQIDAFRSLARE